MPLSVSVVDLREAQAGMRMLIVGFVKTETEALAVLLAVLLALLLAVPVLVASVAGVAGVPGVPRVGGVIGQYILGQCILGQYITCTDHREHGLGAAARAAVTLRTGSVNLFSPYNSYGGSI